MSLRRNPTQSTNYRPDGAIEITKMLKHEARVFKALENGITERTLPSPDVTPEKIQTMKISGGHRLVAGFESGYLGNSQNMSRRAECPEIIDGSTGRNSLPRSKSFSSLHTLSEDPETVFQQPKLLHNNPTWQHQQTTTCNDKTSKHTVPKCSKQFGFDLRNLRLSFRKKKPIPQNPPPLTYAKCDYIDDIVQQSIGSPSFQNRCYFETVNSDCEKCKRLLKDPRMCQCSRVTRPRRLLQIETENLIQGHSVARDQAGHAYQNASQPGGQLTLSDRQKEGLQQSIQLFGAVKKRHKVAIPDSQMTMSQEEIRKSVARFSLAPNTEFSSQFNKTSLPDSQVTLKTTLKLDYIQNKWISDMVVTDKGEMIVVDTKQVYVVDQRGRLKRKIGNKGGCLLKSPIALCLNKNGNVVIMDKLLNSVHVFSTKGQHLKTIEDDSFSNLAAVTCHQNDHIFVVNHQSARISVHDEKNTAFLYSIPTCAVFNGCHSNRAFSSPVSIATNPLTSDILLGDDIRQSVIALTSLGQHKWDFKPSCTTPRPFYPNSLCADQNGYIFVSDLYNCRVYMLDSCGKCLRSLLSCDLGLRMGPSCIAVDNKGQLVVADEERTLKVFTYKNGGFTVQRRVSFCPT